MLGCCKAGSACAVPRCGACFFDRHHDKLKDEFPWLEHSAQPFGVGCSLCRKASADQAHKKLSRGALQWRQVEIISYLSLQPRRLRKHEASFEHQQASRPGLPTQASMLAPTAVQFQDLLSHARKATVGADGIPKVGGQKKCRRMLWCLAEARREEHRDMFRAGPGVDGGELVQSTTLFSDARRGILSLRFTTANSRLEQQQGFFGAVSLSEECSSDAVGLMKGMMLILRNFCTRHKHPPHLERPRQAAIDPDLFARVVASIECFVSDSASDEIRAGHMLARQSTVDVCHPHLPCLKVVTRDKPHAVRRNLTRGWKSDTFLDEVASRFVFGPSSPTRLIQNSFVFRAWFASSIKSIDRDMAAVQLDRHIYDLGFAMHRFESAAKPMSRIVLFFHAFLTTVRRIAAERKHESEGKDAAQFLRWLNLERCLQFSMLADCAMENLELTRLVDYQGFPVEELPSNLKSFQQRCRLLFSGDNPACRHTGFTGHMLKLLKRRIVLHLPDGGVVELGCASGAPSDVFNTCCQRMCNWICIMEATIAAEFPHFETLQAFSIFSVKGEVTLDETRRRLCARQLSRLQRAFGCAGDSDAAEQQFDRLWHVARRVALDEGASSGQSWLEAARRVTRTNRKMEVKALMQALVRFWAAGGSTSGVESSFSRAKKLCDHLQLTPHINDVFEAQLYW